MGQEHPDANLYPHATGTAGSLVSRHQGDRPLKLYAGWFCPFVQRVWMVLEIKDLDYQYKEINPYHKSEDLMTLNPRGLVPTLEYQSKPLYESTVICEFLEDAYPSSTRLLPSDPYARAHARIWIDFVTSRVIPSFHRFLQFQPAPGDQSENGIQEVRKEFLDTLKQFTQEMSADGPYFLGRDLSLVDVSIIPWAMRLWVFDYFKGGLTKATREDEPVWSRWEKWFDAVSNLPCVKNTTSDRHHYLSIYQRYADNTAQSELARATRQGKGVP